MPLWSALEEPRSAAANPLGDHFSKDEIQKVSLLPFAPANQ
jgi:hypothetical protein